MGVIPTRRLKYWPKNDGFGAKPPKMDLADFVLSHFQGEEKKAMEDGYKEAADAVCSLMNNGLEATMNHYNQKKTK